MREHSRTVEPWHATPPRAFTANPALREVEEPLFLIQRLDGQTVADEKRFTLTRSQAPPSPAISLPSSSFSACSQSPSNPTISPLLQT